MKKKILSLALAAVLAVSSLVGGSLAYFTAKDNTSTEFTVGKVAVELVQSKLDRLNVGTAKVDSVTPEGEKGSEPSDAGTTNRPFFTDDQIFADAKTYGNYISSVTKKVVAGDVVNTCTYAQNTGDVDAYVRIKVLVPHSVATKTGVTTAINNQMNTFTKGDEYSVYSAPTKVTINGVDYWSRTCTYNFKLEPGEMTFYNAFSSVSLKDSTTQDQIKQFNAEEFGVKFEVEAIQAKGFDSAAAAFAAYDA